MEHPRSALDENGDADLDPRIQVTIPLHHEVFRCLPKDNCMCMYECCGISGCNKYNIKVVRFSDVHSLCIQTIMCPVNVTVTEVPHQECFCVYYS